MNQESIIDRIYQDTMEDLKGQIIHQHGSVSKFCTSCRDAGFPEPDQFNLSKVFSPNSDREMSVGLYLRILIGLGIAKREDVVGDTLDLKLGLRLYLRINHDVINRSVLLLQFM